MNWNMTCVSLVDYSDVFHMMYPMTNELAMSSLRLYRSVQYALFIHFCKIYEMHIVIFGSSYLFSLDSNPIRCVEQMWVELCLHNGANLKNSQKL